MMLTIRFHPGRSAELNLEWLEAGMPGITASQGAYLAEAAITCLEQERHDPAVLLHLEGVCEHRLQLRWRPQGDPARRARAWGNPDVATEQGACGIAALLIERLTDFTVIEMAKRGPGFDYWLGRKEEDAGLFQDKARLEVSGIRSGDDAQIERRVRHKERQIGRSDNWTIPGVVAVIEFGTPRAKVRTR